MSFATFLQGASPFGPIFGKELRCTARRKRTYFLRVIYMSLLLVALLIAFLITANMSRYGGGVAAQNQQRSQLGQIFFAFFAVFSVFMMGLVGPVLTATAISSERLHKTLPVLLMTPITAWQIVAGKLFSRLLVSMTLIGLGLPVLALVRLLGGVELEQMLGVVALALVAAISSAAIGLFFSTLLNRAYEVILLSFGTMLFLYLFVPFVIAMAWHLMSRRSPGMGALELIWAMNPYWLVFPAAIPDIMRGMIGQLPWAWCLGSHVVMSALLLMWSAMILRRRARKEGDSARGATAIMVAAPPITPPPLPPGVLGSSEAPAVESTPRAHPLPYQPKIPTAKKSRATRQVADNPILWRELRQPLLARRWQRITGICICVAMLGLVYGLLAAYDGLADSDAQGAWACIFNFLIAGILLVISSTAIAQEKESDTWTLLLAAPVSGSTIVWGKAMGILRRIFWPMALVSAHFLVFACCQVISFPAALMAIWIILSFNTIWIATGIYFSLRFGKVTLAVIANLMLAIAAYLFVLGALALVTDADFKGYRDYSQPVDPYWLNLGATVLFWAVGAWWLTTLCLSIWRSRGALGQLIVASMSFFVASVIFAAKMDWISTHRLNEQVGWYVPYYFLAQIGRRGWEGYGQHLVTTEFRLPTGDTVTGAAATMSIVLVIGVGYLLLSAAVLSMTAWKFSAIVGRAPQKRRLPAEASQITSRNNAGPAVRPETY